MIRIALISQVFFLILGQIILTGPELFSYSCGVGLITLQIVAMIWAWHQILFKKSVALAGSVIVIKYAVLFVLTYKLIVGHVVEPLYFLIGSATILPTVLLFGFVHRNKVLNHGAL